MFIKCEIKKILEKKYYKIFIVLGILLNLFYGIYSCHRITTDEMYQHKQQILDEHGGELTKEKVNWIWKQNEKLAKLVESGALNSEYDSSYYTGYVFGDSQIIEELYGRLVELQNYPKRIEDICQEMTQWEELLKKVGNPKLSNVYAKMVDVYEKRSITYLGDETLFVQFEENRVSGFLSVLFALLIFTGVISIDRETEMSQLIGTTVMGKRRIAMIKPLAAVVLSTVVSLILYIEDIFVYGLIYKGFSLEHPLYYYKAYENTFFEGNVLWFLIQVGMIRILGVITIGMLCGVVSIILKNNVFAICVCLILLLAFLLNIPWRNPFEAVWWNPLTGLLGFEWYKIPEVYQVGTKGMLYPYAKMLIGVIYGILAYIAAVIVGVQEEKLC